MKHSKRIFILTFQIEFHYKSSSTNDGESFLWKEPSQDPSYYLCDQKWHDVKVIKTGRSLSIIVDTILTYGGGLTNVNNNNLIRGSLYVGGIRGEHSSVFLSGTEKGTGTK